MRQIKINTFEKKGTHFRWEERLFLQFLREKRKITSPVKLANLLGKSKRTIQREIKRGWVEHTDTFLKKFWTYSPDFSQKKAEENYSAKGPNLKIGNDYVLVNDISNLVLKKHYSPDAVIMYYEKNGWPTETRISTKTLYRYIAEELITDVSFENLLQRGKRGKGPSNKIKRHQRQASAKRSISLRPGHIDSRKEFGHWEMDCVVSGKEKGSEALLVLTERKTRYEIIYKIPDQTSASVVSKLDKLERYYGSRNFRNRFKTITCDNGSEFMDAVGIERSVITKKSRTTLYYAHPYCSSERGSNENANSIIRRFIPKGSAIRDISVMKIKDIQNWMNSYPRRILGGQSSGELYQMQIV